MCETIFKPELRLEPEDKYDSDVERESRPESSCGFKRSKQMFQRGVEGRDLISVSMSQLFNVS